MNERHKILVNKVNPQCKSLCKIKLNDCIFQDWFLKFLLSVIAKDVAFEPPQSEEETILKAR